MRIESTLFTLVSLVTQSPNEFCTKRAPVIINISIYVPSRLGEVGQFERVLCFNFYVNFFLGKVFLLFFLKNFCAFFSQSTMWTNICT